MMFVQDFQDANGKPATIRRFAAVDGCRVARRRSWFALHRRSSQTSRRTRFTRQHGHRCALRNLIEARIGPIVIITGALTRDDLATNPSVANYLAAPSVTTHHNPTWAAGQSTSVRVAIDAAEQIGADAVVIGLADQPFITPDAWRTVAAGLGAITVATYDGRRGNPVRLHADVWDQLPHDGDVGARSLMQLRPELVTEVSCTGSSADIDTLEDLHRWQSN